MTTAVGFLETDGIGNHVNWMRSSFPGSTLGNLATVASMHFPDLEGFDPKDTGERSSNDFAFGVTVGAAVVKQATGKGFGIEVLTDAVRNIPEGSDSIKDTPGLLGDAWGRAVRQMQVFTGRESLSSHMKNGFSVVLAAVLAREQETEQDALDKFNAELFKMLDS